MLCGEYRLPYAPYGFEIEFGEYLFELSSPRYVPLPE